MYGTMPGWNGARALGQGRGAGRRRRRCFESLSQGANERGFFGFGRRRGFGFCWRTADTGKGAGTTNDIERERLLEEKSWLEQRLDSIKQRLNSL